MKLMAWTMLCCAIGLAACQSKSPQANQPQFLTQKIYHGPAQSYDFDLGSPVLRGELKLEKACSVTGSSLNITDQIQQRVRIDTINLHNHPQLGALSEDNLKVLAPHILGLYQNKYQTKLQSSKLYQHPAGDLVIARLIREQSPIDILIVAKHQYTYILQFSTPLQTDNEETVRQRLLTLLKSLKIPGKAISGADSNLPISFDLSNSDAHARQAWQKSYCS